MVEKESVPEYNNFYSCLESVSKLDIKSTLETNGWRARNISKKDFELVNDWSELILEGDENAPLLNVAVAFTHQTVASLKSIFNQMGGKFKFEFYDSSKKLVLDFNPFMI